VVCTSQYANQPPGVVQHTCIGRGRSGLTARYVRAGRPWRSVACRRPSAPPSYRGWRGCWCRANATPARALATGW
jgi:hypothetical protein